MAGLGFIRKAMPWIGAVLGTAVPAAAPFIGLASKLLGTGLNKDVQPNAQSITDTITEAMANPDQLAKLKEVDNQFAVHMRALGIQEETEMAQVFESDMASARQREEVVKDNTPRNLAYLVVGSTLGICAFLVSHHSTILENATMAGFAGTVVGYLIGEAKQVMTYYFGSSAGSASKDETMADLAKGNGHP